MLNLEELIAQIAKDPIKQAQRRDKLAIWKETQLPELREQYFSKNPAPTDVPSPRPLSNSASEVPSNTPETTTTPNATIDSVSADASLPTPKNGEPLGSDSIPADVSPAENAGSAMELDSLDQFMVNVTSEVEKINAEDQERLLKLQREYASKKRKADNAFGDDPSLNKLRSKEDKNTNADLKDEKHRALNNEKAVENKKDNQDQENVGENEKKKERKKQRG